MRKFTERQHSAVSSALPPRLAQGRQAIRLDPYLESAYRMLARVYADSGRAGKARRTRLRYLAHRPQSIEARLQAARAPEAANAEP